MRTTIGTAPPHRYRIFAALFTSWLKPVATKSLNCISPIGRWPRERGADADAEHGAFGERRIEDPIAELLEQRPQQQERVAVRCRRRPRRRRTRADRRAARRRPRASPLRETCCPFRSNGAPGSSGGSAGSASRQPHLRIEHLDAHARRFARQHAVAGLRAAGHGASMTAWASSRRARRPRASGDRARRSSMSPRPRAAPRTPGIGSRADQYAYSSGSRSPGRAAADTPSRAAGPCRDRACRRGARGRTCACRRAR